MKSTGETKLESVVAVPHPNGRESGEFACYEHFELLGGKVLYSYGLPKGEDFQSVDVEVYNCCPTREYAVERLRAELQKLLETKELLEATLAALEGGAGYETRVS